MPTPTNLTQFNDILGWSTFTSTSDTLQVANAGNILNYEDNQMTANYITTGGSLQELPTKASVVVNNTNFAGGTYLLSTSICVFALASNSLFIRFAIQDGAGGIVSTTFDQGVYSYGQRSTNLQAIAEIQQDQRVVLQFRNLSATTPVFNIPSLVINAIRIK